MLSVLEAIDKVVSGVGEMPVEQVSVSEAHGRVLAADLAAAVSHPPDAVSAMDGYAVRWADLAGDRPALTVTGESAAGHPYPNPVGAGEAVRIFTGARIPDGSDTIVIQEDTELDGDRVIVTDKPKEKGEFVRPRGMDFAVGDVLLRAGRILTARDVGLAASMNHAWVFVRRRPRIAYLATGDEVKMPGSDLGPGQIVSSNSLALPAYVRALGGVPVSLGIAKDTEEDLLRALRGARGCDMLITMGGASVGDHDLVQRALGHDGFELGFYKIAMRPGKPLIFGNIQGVPFLGLPGNPVSTGVTSAIFLRAALIKMLCIAGAETHATAVLGSDVPKNGIREDYMRASLACNDRGQLVATPFSAQDSAMMGAFARADCLVIRSVGAAPEKAGTTVPILRLDFGGLPF